MRHLKPIGVASQLPQWHRVVSRSDRDNKARDDVLGSRFAPTFTRERSVELTRLSTKGSCVCVNVANPKKSFVVRRFQQPLGACPGSGDRANGSRCAQILNNTPGGSL
jgi:hypothetical protein